MPAKKHPQGSSSDLAELIQVSARRVAQLANEGVLPRLPTGDFDLPDSIERFYVYKIAPPESLDYAEEKAKHEKVKRELSELELARRKGLVHASEDVEMVMTDMLSNLRAQLLALPSKLAPMLADRSRDYIYGLLESEIKDRLTELSDYSPELFTDVETPSDDDAGQEDD